MKIKRSLQEKEKREKRNNIVIKGKKYGSNGKRVFRKGLWNKRSRKNKHIRKKYNKREIAVVEMKDWEMK